MFVQTQSQSILFFLFKMNATNCQTPRGAVRHKSGARVCREKAEVGLSSPSSSQLSSGSLQRKDNPRLQKGRWCISPTGLPPDELNSQLFSVSQILGNTLIPQEENEHNLPRTTDQPRAGTSQRIDVTPTREEQNQPGLQSKAQPKVKLSLLNY